MHASPESTPGLNEALPKGPTWSLGLLGAKASSSIGLNAASAFFLAPLRIYVPLVPSSVSLGFSPFEKPASISLMVFYRSIGHCIDPNISMHFDGACSIVIGALPILVMFCSFNLLSFARSGASLSTTILSLYSWTICLMLSSISFGSSWASSSSSIFWKLMLFF